MGVGSYGGGGGPSSLKFRPGVGLGGGVKIVIYFLEGGGGNLETPLTTPLRYGGTMQHVNRVTRRVRDGPRALSRCTNRLC